jgi:hypothetical protein
MVMMIATIKAQLTETLMELKMEVMMDLLTGMTKAKKKEDLKE